MCGIISWTPMMTVFNQKTADFQLVKGPVHTNILLADEISRAIPRTQSALLEAMEEGLAGILDQVFYGGREICLTTEEYEGYRQQIKNLADEID